MSGHPLTLPAMPALFRAVCSRLMPCTPSEMDLRYDHNRTALKATHNAHKCMKLMKDCSLTPPQVLASSCSLHSSQQLQAAAVFQGLTALLTVCNQGMGSRLTLGSQSEPSLPSAPLPADSRDAKVVMLYPPDTWAQSSAPCEKSPGKHLSTPATGTQPVMSWPLQQCHLASVPDDSAHGCGLRSV